MIRIHPQAVFHFCCSILLLLHQPAAAQTLTILPNLPPIPGGSSSGNQAIAISADGNTVVGASETSMDSGGDPGYEAFRWNRNSGLQSLGFASQSPKSLAKGVSADGSTIVGDSYNQEGWNQGFRWTATTGMVTLGIPSGSVETRVSGISANGQFTFGSTLAPGDGGLLYSQAMRWTEATGFENLGYLSGWGRESTITGSSEGGDVLVGFSRESQANRTQAIRWTESTSMQGLGFLPGGNRSSASAVSGDGSTIVGSGNSSNAVLGSEAFRWTEDSGILRLNENPPSLGGFISMASGVSFDGSAIVGRARFGVENILEAFLWTEDQGMRSLNAILDAASVDRDGWFLTWARDISSDGSVIIGSASNGSQSRGFVLDFRVVPEPSSVVVLLMVMLAFVKFWRQSPKPDF